MQAANFELSNQNQRLEESNNRHSLHTAELNKMLADLMVKEREGWEREEGREGGEGREDEDGKGG